MGNVFFVFLPVQIECPCNYKGVQITLLLIQSKVLLRNSIADIYKYFKRQKTLLWFSNILFQPKQVMVPAELLRKVHHRVFLIGIDMN